MLCDIEVPDGSVKQRTFEQKIQVESCDPGFQLERGRCQQCKLRTYSIHGLMCFACPTGANCVIEEIINGGSSEKGVPYPRTMAGYYLGDAPESQLPKLCDDKSSFASNDPCDGGIPETRVDRIHNCSTRPLFNLFWDENRIFQCLTEMNFYKCEIEAACKADIVPQALLSEPEASCAEGYQSLMCSVCEPLVYRKTTKGTCKLCNEQKTGWARFFEVVYGLVSFVFMLLAFYLIYSYMRDESEIELMKEARAARKFEIYVSSGRRLGLFGRIKKHFSDKKASQRTTTEVTLFNIDVPIVETRTWLKPEKFKIMLSFFQIFSGFRDTYNIQWPKQVTDLMEMYTKLNFDFVSVAGFDCYFNKNYYFDFDMTIGITVFSLVCVFLLSRWGIFMYRRKLKSIPRHCVKCGLPVREEYKRSADANLPKAGSVRHLKQSMESRLTHVGDINWRDILCFWRRRKTDDESRIIAGEDRESMMSKMGSHKSDDLPKYSAMHRECPTQRRITGETLDRTVRSNLKLWQARMKLRMNYTTYRNKCVKLAFWILLVFYPSVSRNILGVFNCEEIGDAFYLVRDRKVQCFDSMWFFNATLALGGVGIWVVGVPFLFWFYLFRARHKFVKARLEMLRDPEYSMLRQRWLTEVKEDHHAHGKHWDAKKFSVIEDELLEDYMKRKNLNDSGVVARLGFIYHSYDENFWWYEVMELIRKLIFNGVMVFIAKGSIEQILASLFVCLIYLALLLFFQPYLDPTDDLVAAVAQFQLFVTLFFGMLLKMRIGTGTRGIDINNIGYVIVASNVMAVLLTVITIMREKKRQEKDAKIQGRIQYLAKVKVHVKTLWQRAYYYALVEALSTGKVSTKRFNVTPGIVNELRRRHGPPKSTKSTTDPAEQAPISPRGLLANFKRSIHAEQE